MCIYKLYTHYTEMQTATILALQTTTQLKRAENSSLSASLDNHTCKAEHQILLLINLRRWQGYSDYSQTNSCTKAFNRIHHSCSQLLLDQWLCPGHDLTTKHTCITTAAFTSSSPLPWSPCCFILTRHSLNSAQKAQNSIMYWHKTRISQCTQDKISDVRKLATCNNRLLTTVITGQLAADQR